MYFFVQSLVRTKNLLPPVAQYFSSDLNLWEEQRTTQRSSLVSTYTVNSHLAYTSPIYNGHPNNTERGYIPGKNNNLQIFD